MHLSIGKVLTCKNLIYLLNFLFPLSDLPEYFKRGNKLSNNKKKKTHFYQDKSFVGNSLAILII